MTKLEALQTIQNIYECNGYKETEGNDWLGARLHSIQSFIKTLPEHPDCYCSSLSRGRCDFCTGIR